MESRPSITKPGAPFGKSEPRHQPKPPRKEPGLPQGEDEAGGDGRKSSVGSGDRPKTPKPGTGR
jgi:hypothetical protein